jgi:ankyrin repeat protein
MNNCLDIAKELLKRGDNIDIRDKDGNTLLIHAIFNDDIKTTESLLKEGANAYLKNECGYTALMYTSLENNLEIVKLLLNQRRYINTKNAFQIATKYGHDDIVNLVKTI